jgi:hypothetical protein
MNLEEKAKKTVIKLVQMTVKGELSWDRITDTHILTRGTDDVIPVAYSTKGGESRFALFEAKHPFSPDGEEVFWNSRIELRMIDFDGNTIWSFPPLPALRTLYDQVVIRAGNIGGRLDEFLNS